MPLQLTCVNIELPQNGPHRPTGLPKHRDQPVFYVNDWRRPRLLRLARIVKCTFAPDTQRRNIGRNASFGMRTGNKFTHARGQN